MVSRRLLKFISPTLNFEAGHIASLPIKDSLPENITQYVDELIKHSKADWDSSETSWGFKCSPLVNKDSLFQKFKDQILTYISQCENITKKTCYLENRLNSSIHQLYGYKEVIPIPLSEISLDCNLQFKNDNSNKEYMVYKNIHDFISYAVGCMFGRYSLDREGLILANQGETIEDYNRLIPNPTFAPDEDNCIPIVEGDFFVDDIVDRFRQFLRVTFGDEHFQENLEFIENALNVKQKANYSIRDYFINEFYDDHVKRYKKRPIYWLFSSPKGSFKALIYMHRYRPDTLSIVLNDYLRKFRDKLQVKFNQLENDAVNPLLSPRERTAAVKEKERVSKMLKDVETYDRDTLYPLAAKNIEIDLDDGVKVNYLKFGAALKKITGLDAKED